MMPTALSKQLRDRFQRYIEEGLSGREAALRLKISPATGARWRLSFLSSGRVQARKQGRPKGNGRVCVHQSFFKELIKQDPDITLYELRDALEHAQGLRVDPSSIYYLLKRIGFTHKKSRWWPPSVNLHA